MIFVHLQLINYFEEISVYSVILLCQLFNFLPNPCEMFI